MEKEEEYDFEKDYEALKKEYNLPVLETFAEDFDIEKIQEKPSMFLARDIRRTINEKITVYIHLFETLINPSSPPIFVFKLLKNMSEKESKQIKEFYNTLSRTQIEIMKLDTIYSEENEIKFIKKTYKTWQEMKTKINIIFESFESNFENGDTSKERSYFD